MPIGLSSFGVDYIGIRILDGSGVELLAGVQSVGIEWSYQLVADKV